MKTKFDYAKPFWQRKKTKFEKLIDTWAGFFFVILMLVLGGSEF